MGQIFHNSTPSFKSDIWIDWESRGELITSIDDTGVCHYLEFSIIRKNGQSDISEGGFSITVDELKQILEYYEKYKSEF
jgi:hypothetical protein